MVALREGRHSLVDRRSCWKELHLLLLERLSSSWSSWSSHMGPDLPHTGSMEN